MAGIVTPINSKAVSQEMIVCKKIMKIRNSIIAMIADSICAKTALNIMDSFTCAQWKKLPSLL